ncbi:TolC family protein [Altericroceibacterium spongiae]|uniref:TolC family protein n=1 Tax=Altericroceibacterium spongiae TaxID=2320269 RepID=A0A420EEH2_9SPHN|nr:TolC family protein [Altericroceibacterium spongiae]RKF19081.1 TolC family protein [Altericroceibacterium spongiae]
MIRFSFTAFAMLIGTSLCWPVQAQMIAPLPVVVTDKEGVPSVREPVGPTLHAPSPSSLDSTHCLSFTTALRLATGHSPERTLAQAEQQIARARLKQERGTGLPSLSAYARAADGDTGLVDGRTNTQSGLIASQRIFDFDQGHFRMKAARERSRAALFKIVDASTQARIKAGETYLDILEARERLAAARRRESRFTELSNGVDRRLETGLITKATASSILAEAASASAQRVEVELAMETAQIEIGLLTGNTQSLCGKTDDVNKTLDLPPVVMHGPFDSLSAAMAAPDVKAAMAMRDAALADLETSRRLQRPVISIKGIGAYQYDELLKRWEFAKKIGLDIEMPLYSGGSYGGERDEARARAASAAGDIQRLTRNYRRQLEQGIQRIHALGDVASARDEAVAAQRDEVAAVREQFERGLRPYQDYERAEADLAQSEVSSIAAHYAALRERLQVLALLGLLPAKMH